MQSHFTFVFGDLEISSDACGIYCIRNMVNGKRYIGSSARLGKRLRHHVYLLEKEKHTNRYLQAAWKKYGAENFAIEILELVEAEQQYPREQYYLDTFKPEYNLSFRAIGFSGIYTDEHRRRISAAGKAWYQNNPDKREARRQSLIGKNKPSEESVAKLIERNKNRVVTDETRQKLSESHKGKKHTEEQKAKISASSKGRQVSEETRQKIAQTLRGHGVSEETRQKMSEAGKGRKLSPEALQRRGDRIREGHAKRTPEERSEHTRRAWRTRRERGK